MLLVSVMYPNEGGVTFDERYYLHSHIPLVKSRWGSLGLEDIQVVRGLDGPDGGAAPYRVMALLRFRSRGDFEAAVKQHGGEIFGDIPKFSNGKPVVQLSEILA
jgi:uncharacterized protein (TIGR02118 family)